MGVQQRLQQLGQAVRDWRYRNVQDPFSKPNPGFRGLDRRAAAAMDDESDTLEPASQRQRLIADRARHAQTIAASRQRDRTQQFAQLNPHAPAPGHSMETELGERVAAALADENHQGRQDCADTISERGATAEHRAEGRLLEHLRTPAPNGGHDFAGWSASQIGNNALVRGDPADLVSRLRTQHRHDHRQDQTRPAAEFPHTHPEPARSEPAVGGRAEPAAQLAGDRSTLEAGRRGVER
jgi:hypothetical protein